MITKDYTLYSVGVGAVLIGGITAEDVNYGNDPLKAVRSGGVYPKFVGNMKNAPVLTFKSADLVAALGVAWLGGKTLSASAKATFYFQKMKDGGIRDAAGHVSAVIGKGIMVPRSIEAAQDGEASVTMEVIGTSDGANSPVVEANGAAIPAEGAEDKVYTLGAVSLNGSSIEGVQSISIDTGISVRVARDGGDPYPTFCAIVTVAPVLTIVTQDLSVLDLISTAGEPISAPCTVALRKLLQGSILGGEDEDDPLLFTVNAGMILGGSASGKGEGGSLATLMIHPAKDATNDIVVFSVPA